MVPFLSSVSGKVVGSVDCLAFSEIEVLNKDLPPAILKGWEKLFNLRVHLPTSPNPLLLPEPEEA